MIHKVFSRLHDFYSALISQYKMKHSDSSDGLDMPLTTDDLLLSLCKTASTLLGEYRSFQEYLQARNEQHEVDLRIFRKGLKAEFDALEKLVSQVETSRSDENALHEGIAATKRAHLAKTTNIPHYQLWWSVAKQCRGIRGLGRRVAMDRSQPVARGPRSKKPQKQGEEIQIDIIADDGQEWLKISSVTEKRLIFEMAKQGWEEYGDASETDADDASQQCHNEIHPTKPTPKLELLKLVEALQLASRSVRVRYRHPRVHIVLPNIPSTPHPSIRALLADLRATGAKVTHGTSNLQARSNRPAPISALHDLLPFMCPTSAHQPQPTPTLNIDTSILIALLSDQCHAPPCALPARPFHSCSQSYHAAIRQQMAAEERRPLLQNTIYPLLAGRELVCATSAAERAREIVSAMGTDTERARAAILLPIATPSAPTPGPAAAADDDDDDDPSHEQSRPSNTVEQGQLRQPEQLRRQWQALSTHPMPPHFQLPIREIPVHIPTLLGNSSCSDSSRRYSPSDNDQNNDQDNHNSASACGGKDAASTWPAQPLARTLYKHMCRAPTSHSQTPSLSELNVSVLFLGWRQGLVTVTSNGLAVKATERGLGEVLDLWEAEDHDVDAEVAMPRFWVVEDSRSLVGREKKKKREGENRE